jgi:hypothetical protein
LPAAIWIFTTAATFLLAMTFPFYVLRSGHP